MMYLKRPFDFVVITCLIGFVPVKPALFLFFISGYLLLMAFRRLYYQRLLLALFSNLFMLVFLFQMMVILFYDDSFPILHLNEMAFTYLIDGTLMKIAVAGFFFFLLGQFLVLRGFGWEKIAVAGYESNDASAFIKPKAKNRAYFLLIGLFLSWTTVYALDFNIVWINPHMETYYSFAGGIGGQFISMFRTLNIFLVPVALEYALRHDVRLKLLSSYVLVLSFMSFSCGSRTGAAIPIVSYLLLLILRGRIKPAFRTFLGFCLFASFIAVVLGPLRSNFALFGFYSTLKYFFDDILSCSLSSIVCSVFPIVAQNIAHYASYLYLYDTGQPSSFAPYLSGLLNILPRSLGVGVGLPVDSSYSHADQLRHYGIIHTGGSNLFGEPYWLGGLFCLLFINLLFGAIVMTFDLVYSRKRAGGLFTGHYLAGTLLMTLGIGYGFTTWIRGLYLVVLTELICRFVLKKAQVGREAV